MADLLAGRRDGRSLDNAGGADPSRSAVDASVETGSRAWSLASAADRGFIRDLFRSCFISSAVARGGVRTASLRDVGGHSLWHERGGAGEPGYRHYRHHRDGVQIRAL